MKSLPQEIRQASPLNKLKTAQIGFLQQTEQLYMANKLTTASAAGGDIYLFIAPSLSEGVLELWLRSPSKFWLLEP